MVLFPRGRAGVRSPAASPLPGHLPAEHGPHRFVLAVALLVASGVAASGRTGSAGPAHPIVLAVRFRVGPYDERRAWREGRRRGGLGDSERDRAAPGTNGPVRDDS
ncbi:hypothetical protein ACH4TV_14915 [Streptomyces sp. NPDC020898]|uniref:hypothetical protein n=1 Tax=Streptomyces sp. NPDC020898 TaxID=3365101 RepID=UPI00378AB110